MSATNLPLEMTADLNITPLVSAAKQAKKSLAEVVDYAKKSGTLELTAKLSGTSIAAMKQQIDAVGSRTLPFMFTFDGQSVQNSLTALRGMLNGVVSINTSALTAVQAQVNTQISQMTALIAQLRALGGSGGSGGGRAGGSSAGGAVSAGTRAMLTDLEELNNQYRRGEIDADHYAVQLLRLQTSLRSAAAMAIQGSTEFRQLDGALTRTVQGLRNVESGKITALQTELRGARAQFDAAAAAATNLAERRAAIAQYEGTLNRIRVGLEGMASSGRLTEQQLGRVNGLLAQTARESNTINGGTNIAGLSGNISNALQNMASNIPGVSALQGVLGEIPPQLLAIAAAGALMSVGLAASFKTAAEFQQKMADINALTTPTAEQLGQLTETAKNFGIPLGIGARDAADAVLSLSKAGLSAADIMGGGLASALNLAAAAGIDTAKAGDLAVTAWTAFGKQDDLSHIADVYANFANQTVLGAEDLGQALAAVGPVAKSAGLDLQQFSGYMAVLAQGGFKNMSDAGTSLKTMLLSLQAPSTTAAQAMSNIGLNVYDAQGKFLPFNEQLQNLRDKLKGLTEQQRNNTLKTIFGTDGIRAATILYGQSAEAIQKNIDAMGAQGSAANVAKSRLETYNGAVGVMQANFEALRVEIGEKLLPAATGIVEFLNGGVTGIRDMANNTQTLTGYLVPLAPLLATIAGPQIVAGLGAVAGGIASAATASMAWAAANPFAVVAIAVAALAIKVNSLYAETAKIYEQVDKADQENHDKSMARVNALIAKNTDLSRAQAQYLLANQRLQAAESGKVVGTKWTGERVYAVDPEEVKKEQAEVEKLRQTLQILQQQSGKKGASAKSTQDATGIDPTVVERQSKALESLRDNLTSRLDAANADVPPKLTTKIAQIERAYIKLGKELKKSFGGNLNNIEYLKGVAEMDAAKHQEISAMRRKWATDENKKRQEEQEKAAAALSSAQNAAEKGRIDAMADGVAKRRALRQLEIKEEQDSLTKSLIGVKDGGARAQLAEASRIKIQGINAKYDVLEVKEREDSARKVAEISQKALFDRQAAEIAAMQDGAAKRAAQRDLDIAQAQAATQKEVEAAKGKPAEIAAIQAAGNAKVREINDKYRQGEQEAAREHARKLLDLAVQAQQDQAALAAAQRGVVLAQFEHDAAQRLTTVKKGGVEEAQLEAQIARERAALTEQQAQATAAAEIKALGLSRDKALSADKLSAEDRQAIWAHYNSEVAALDAKTHADALTRLADREAKEREAAEKIRAARIQAAAQPAEKLGNEIDSLRSKQGLTESTAQKLALESQIEAKLQAQAGVYAGILAQAGQLRLTDAERKQYASELEKTQQGVNQSAKQMLDYQKAITGEARDIADQYGKIMTLTGTESGTVAAQRDMERATTDLGNAYSKALPYLEQMRDKRLRPEDFTEAKTALDGLVGALEAQKQKLEALRSEYQQQRDALKDIQGVLAGFGTDLKSEGLLNDAITFNQTSYDQAKTALDTLLKGGKYDAAQLSEATKTLQTSYTGLKDSVSALGEEQAKQYEKEIERLKYAAEKRNRGVDKQIRDAKNAGQDTSVMEKQQQQAADALDRQVWALEDKAKKAREGVEAAMKTRTQGVQDTLAGVGTAAAQAQPAVDALGKQVKTTEQDVKDSAAKMRASLTGTFAGLPALAGKAGTDAGQQFLAQFQASLKKNLKLPAVSVGVGRVGGAAGTMSAVGGGTTINQTITINGQNITGTASTTTKGLLKQLAAAADAECRRRNS